jgi:hypothetical protein
LISPLETPVVSSRAELALVPATVSLPPLLSKLYFNPLALPFTTRVVTSTLCPGGTFAADTSHSIAGAAGTAV